MELNLSIRGYLVGQIWMPATECWKDLTYSITREDTRFSEPLTLREHVLRATNDGDFQSCQIADGVLIAETTRRTKTGITKRVRSWPLDRFPSIEDCIRTDWDGPCGEDD